MYASILGASFLFSLLMSINSVEEICVIREWQDGQVEELYLWKQLSLPQAYLLSYLHGFKVQEWYRRAWYTPWCWVSERRSELTTNSVVAQCTSSSFSLWAFSWSAKFFDESATNSNIAWPCRIRTCSSVSADALFVNRSVSWMNLLNFSRSAESWKSW